jgi:hypothetical protein
MSTPIGQVYTDSAYFLAIEGFAAYEFGPSNQADWNALVTVSPTLLLNLGNTVLAENLRHLTLPGWAGLVWLRLTSENQRVLVKMATEGSADAIELERLFLAQMDESLEGETL